MAAYSGTPTNLATFEVGDRAGRLVYVYKRLSLTLSSQGGATNTIGAVALGYRSGGLISAQCVLFTDGGSQKRAVWCFTDGTNLYIGDPTQATDGNRAIPADVTGTLIVELHGLV